MSFYRFLRCIFLCGLTVCFLYDVIAVPAVYANKIEFIFLLGGLTLTGRDRRYNTRCWERRDAPLFVTSCVRACESRFGRFCFVCVSSAYAVFPIAWILWLLRVWQVTNVFFYRISREREKGCRRCKSRERRPWALRVADSFVGFFFFFYVD